MNNINKIREIYRECFGEDTEFENLLFETCAKNLKIYKIGGEPVSFLFALPCLVKSNINSLEAVYIFAAATNKEFRNKGFMGKLLEELKSQTDMPLILRPANNYLVSYYEKFGFQKFIAQDTSENTLKLLPEKEFKTLAEITEKTTEGEFIAMAFNCNSDLNDIYFPYSMP